MSPGLAFSGIRADRDYLQSEFAVTREFRQQSGIDPLRTVNIGVPASAVWRKADDGERRSSEGPSRVVDHPASPRLQRRDYSASGLRISSFEEQERIHASFRSRRSDIDYGIKPSDRDSSALESGTRCFFNGHSATRWPARRHGRSVGPDRVGVSPIRKAALGAWL